MSNPHFFKLKSRLGLITIPHGQTEVNTGVENGPDAIITEKILRLLNNPPVQSFDFPLPEDIKKEEYYQEIAKISLAVAEKISKLIHEGETQVVIGGDHSVTYTSLLALQERIDLSTIGYLQIDSHGDIHQVATSPTGNFHGMYIRAFLDGIGSQYIDPPITSHLSPHNMLYIGNLDLEIEEKEYFQKNNIRNISRKELLRDQSAFKQFIKNFVSSYPHIHLTIDVDGFDQSIVKATGIPALEGLFFEDILPVLEVVKGHPSISIDLVEVNPQKDGADQTIQLAQTILKRLLN